MKILYAITKQTVREALRSKIFHVLLVLTVAAVLLLPLTVAGDGTATAAVQAILTYSLQAVTVLLTLSAIWLGCTGLSREIESHRIHMIFTKPVPPWKAWLGKWLAVVLMNGAILLFAAVMIFLLVQWRIHSGEFSEEELARARNEVLVGRQVYEPERPDPRQLAEAEYRRMMEAGRLDPDHDSQRVLSELLRQHRAGTTEIRPNMTNRWRLEGVNLPRDEDVPVYFRYRLYVATTSQAEQRETVGIWRFINPDAAGQEGGEAFLPIRSAGGMFYEERIPASLVSEGGELIVEYRNFDPQEEIVVVQEADGPSLLVSVAGFSGNYWRGIAVIFLRLGFFAGLGCALGAMFSGPVALFLAFAYMAVSILVNAALGGGGQAAAAIPAGHNLVTYAIAVAVDQLIISLQEFDIPDLLSNGRLVSGGRIASAAFLQVLLRGGPLALISIIVFSRREMGKVVRQ